MGSNALVWASYLDVRRNKGAPRMRRADFENVRPAT
ncbi:reverse transcriptase [Shigella boydii]|nr:reverse transcriptase [Shigella boydii]EFZ0000753.1 reverse transcriptase [Shigella boydii]